MNTPDPIPVCLSLPGPSLKMGMAEELKDNIQEYLDDGVINLVLNFTEVKFIDSSILGLMIGTLKKLKSQGGMLKICHVNPSVMNVLKIVRLNEFIEVFPDEASALASFK
jgi:anti-sigma B factor antagonist